MIKRLVRLWAALVAGCAVMGSAHAEPSTPKIPGLSEAARDVIFDGEPLRADFSWARWRFSDDRQAQADWQALVDWVEKEKRKQTDRMIKSVSRLHDREIQSLKLDGTCFANLACWRVQTGVNLSQAYETLAAFDAIFDQATAAHNGFLNTLDVSKRVRANRLVESDPFKRELIVRTHADQIVRFSHQSAMEFQRDELAPMIRLTIYYTITMIDLDNTEFLKSYVEQYGWPKISDVGKEAAKDAWLLAQHADFNPHLQIKWLAMMERMVDVGEVEAKYFAYLYDRVQRGLNLPQRYGTQGRCGDGAWAPDAVEDPAHLAQRRAEMDLEPMEKYIARFRGMC